MKRKLLYTAWAIGGLFAACSSEDAPSVSNNKEVNLQIAGTVTRTVTNGNVTTFVEGDQIGITSSGLETDMNNATFTVTSDGGLTGGVFYYNGSNKATFYAHYPATAAYNIGKVTMTVPSAQATEASFNSADFMTATAIGDPADNGAVKLQFKHRLALVKVIWNGTTTATDILMKNVKNTTTWVQSTDVCTTSGETIEINTWKQNGKQEYWALIPEQTIAQGTELLIVNDEEKSYSYTSENDINFSSSAAKKIVLSLNEDGESVSATISNIDIDDWSDDTTQTEGKVEEVVLPPVELIPSGAITLTPNSKNNAVAGAWNVALDKGNSVIEVQEGGNLHINLAATNEAGNASSWWNNAVYYRPSEALAGKIKPKLYKLSFKAKASAAGKGFMVQVMKGDESANTYFGIINSDPAGKDDVNYIRMYYPSFKEEELEDYVTMNYWVHFGKIVSTDGKTITEGNVGDYEKVLLTFSVNTGTSDANAYGIDFWFKDFTFTEVK